MKSLLILLVLSMGLVACDPYHKKQCEWVLTAEPEGIKMMSKIDVENDWIPVCARNYVVDKQRCNLKVKLKMAKAVQDKAFKLIDMKVNETGLYPKAIESIKTCTPSKPIRPEDMKKK